MNLYKAGNPIFILIVIKKKMGCNPYACDNVPINSTLKNEDSDSKCPTTDFIKSRDSRKNLADYSNSLLASSRIEFGASKKLSRQRPESSESSSTDEEFLIPEDEENKKTIVIPYKATTVGSYLGTNVAASALPLDKGLGFDYRNLVKKKSFSCLGRYEMLETIGKGTYGVVKKIRHKVTGNLYALKIISKNSWFTGNNEVSEIGILKKLDHPNILQPYEFTQSETEFYLITEYCEGGQLLKYLTREKRFTEAMAAKFMKQILSAVSYCHARQIVHRQVLDCN